MYVLLICFVVPVVPTECDVLIVGNMMTIIVHFTIEHQVCYDWKFKEQHAKIWENIEGAKDTLAPPRGFNITGASALVALPFRRLCKQLRHYRRSASWAVIGYDVLRRNEKNEHVNFPS